MKKNAVIIGSGNIGRGLDANILALNGYNITFLDVSKENIDKINSEKTYDIHILGTQTKFNVNNIQGIQIPKHNEEASDAIASANIIMISIGINNLPKLSDLIISSLTKRMTNKNPINIVAVENGLNATNIIKDVITKRADNDLSEYIKTNVGFVNCAVDRIVPNQSNSSIDVYVEKFYELVLDNSSWKGRKIEYVSYSNDLMKYVNRKLFMLNATHSFIAWYGIKNGYKYIYEFNKNKIIFDKVVELLREFSQILIQKFNFTDEELEQYSKKIIKRLSDLNIKDEVTRVGRGVIRKLSFNDRWVTPLMFSIKHGLENNIIKEGIAIPFSGLLFDDPEQEELNSYINKYGVKKAILKYTGVSSELADEIINKSL